MTQATTTTYTEARKKLKFFLDKVCKDHVYIEILRRNGENVVLLSREDFNSLNETAYLMRSPKNAQRLMEAMSEKTKKNMIFKDVNELKHEFGIED